MDELKQQLNAATVSISTYVEENKVKTSYQWAITADDVAGIRVSLCGWDHLTGKPIEEEEVARLSPSTLSKTSRPLPYDGCYQLRFDAIDANGQVIAWDFRERKSIQLLNPAKRATVQYSTQQIKKDWQLLVIETNCPERCRGKLWARYDRQYQMIPLLQSGRNELYLPTADKNTVLLFCETDNENLQPIEIVPKG